MTREELVFVVTCTVLALDALFIWKLRPRVSKGVNNNFFIATGTAVTAVWAVTDQWYAAVVPGVATAWAVWVDAKRRRREAAEAKAEAE